MVKKSSVRSPSLPSASVKKAASPLAYGLTRRELEVIQTLGRNSTYREIATSLLIGTESVRKHATNIYNKTGTDSLQSLLLFAIRKRLLTIEVEEQR